MQLIDTHFHLDYYKNHRYWYEKINELKINYSAYLLWATDYTIPEICEKIGIESVSYFHKLFKKRYGTTPHKKKIKQSIDS